MMWRDMRVPAPGLTRRAPSFETPNPVMNPPVAASTAPRGREAAMSFIMLTGLLDMIAMGLIIPGLPHLVGPFADTRAEKTMWFGVVARSFVSAHFFGSPMASSTLRMSRTIRLNPWGSREEA